MLDLGSEGAEVGGREVVWFLVNHLAGLESSCENPEGDAERGNTVVDVAPVEEGSYGLKEWGCEGLRRERMVDKVRERCSKLRAQQERPQGDRPRFGYSCQLDRRGKTSEVRA